MQTCFNLSNVISLITKKNIERTFIGSQPYNHSLVVMSQLLSLYFIDNLQNFINIFFKM